MSKKSVTIISAILISCFLITLTFGLIFVVYTPNQNRMVSKFINAGFEYSKLNWGKDITIYGFGDDDRNIIIVWYKDDETAKKGLETLCKLKGSKQLVKRGNAIAMGDKDLMKIFKSL